MSILYKTAAGVLITVVIYLLLSQKDKDFSILLSILACCMVIAASVSFFEPVINFLEDLTAVGNLNSDILSIILKVTGIGLLSEITLWICTDAGCTSIGKAFQILSSYAMIWLSLPLFEKMLELIDNILGGI